MIELIFVACMVNGAGECRENSLLFSNVSLLTCVSQAQIPLSEWSAGHPNWTVERWSCQPVDNSSVRL